MAPFFVQLFTRGPLPAASDIMKDIKNLEQKQAKLEQENEQLKQQLAALKK